MHLRLDAVPVLIKLQEDLLRQFLGDARVLREVVGDAVKHALMVPNNHFESSALTVEPRYQSRTSQAVPSSNSSVCIRQGNAQKIV